MLGTIISTVYVSGCVVLFVAERVPLDLVKVEVVWPSLTVLMDCSPHALLRHNVIAYGTDVLWAMFHIYNACLALSDM